MEIAQPINNKEDAIGAHSCVFIISKGPRKYDECGKRIVTVDKYCTAHRKLINQYKEMKNNEYQDILRKPH